MKHLTDAKIENRRALVRVDFNVPLDENQQVTDDLRIREAIPTLNMILQNGGSIVLMSHLGRPKGKVKPEYSLKPVVSVLEGLLKREVIFAGDALSEEAYKITGKLEPGQVVLLENLRFHPEEEAGDRAFAEKLAVHGDFYVNDAFGTAHRAHASTAIVADSFEEKYPGLLMEKEIKMAEKVLHQAEHPFTAIMGGAKVSDKIMVIEQLLDQIDYLLIGGGMAYTFLKAKGNRIGKSLLEEDKVAIAAALLKKARQKNVTVITPVDSVVAPEFSAEVKTMVVRNEDFPDDQMGLDIGPATFDAFHDVIVKSKTVLWNGPMGVFEMEPYAQGTIAVAHALVEATNNGAFTLVGGGDSAAAVKEAGADDKVSYVSTGGGALLEYMEGQELPGIAALG